MRRKKGKEKRVTRNNTFADIIYFRDCLYQCSGMKGSIPCFFANNTKNLALALGFESAIDVRMMINMMMFFANNKEVEVVHTL